MMLLSRLREETRFAHQQLEGRIDLLERDWSLPFYRVFLQKFYGFYAAIEEPIFAHSQWEATGLEVGKRLKTRFLKSDLEFLGLSNDAIANLPLCANAPLASTFPEALGCAYVLEGSTLGGQVITRHLQRELGVGPGSGGTFFASYGVAVGPMWREFIEVLDTYSLDEIQQNAAIHSANATFRAFDAWLQDVL
jgi:heme oxygenase